jgi:hypothetical protein
MKPSRPTTIISLNTNLVARSWLSLPDRTTRNHIHGLIKQGSQDMPMLPDYFISVSLARGCAQLPVTKRRKEILTAGLAWADGDSDAAGLWIWLQDYRDARCSQRLISGSTRLAPEPPCPWLATLYRPSVARLPLFEATALVVYQRHLMAHLSCRAPKPF